MLLLKRTNCILSLDMPNHDKNEFKEEMLIPVNLDGNYTIFLLGGGSGSLFLAPKYVEYCETFYRREFCTIALF